MSNLTELEAIYSDLSSVLSKSNTALSNKGVSAVASLSKIAATIKKIATGTPYATGTARGTGYIDLVTASTLTITHNLGVKPSYVIIYRPSTSYNENSIWLSFNTSAIYTSGAVMTSNFADEKTVSLTNTTTKSTFSSTPESAAGYDVFSSSYSYTWYAIA